MTNLAAAAKAGNKLSGKQAAEDAEESLKKLDGNSGISSWSAHGGHLTNASCQRRPGLGVGLGYVNATPDLSACR